MLLYVGEEKNGFFVAEIAARYGIACKFTGYVKNLNKTTDVILSYTDLTYIIIDICNIHSNPSEITKFLEKLKFAVKSHIIFFAGGYTTESELVQRAAQAGIKYFILAPLLGKQKEELDNCLNLIPNNDFYKPEPKPVPKLKPLSPQNKPYQSIAVASCISRMGATTAALQTVKYLLLKGKRVCYIQMNTSNFCSQLLDYIEEGITHDSVQGKITYQHIEMYYDQSQISDVLKQPYDFYVYDFGCMTAENFQSISYFEKTYKFMVCGSKPAELDSLQAIISQIYNKDIYYLFNHCTENEHKDIRELMEDKSESTFFPSYTPDMFCYSSGNNEMFDKIFISEFEEEQPANVSEKKEKKKGWFNRRKKDKQSVAKAGKM